MSIYKLTSVAMMHYEYFINIYKCVYNALWILGLSEVFPNGLFGKHALKSGWSA